MTSKLEYKPVLPDSVILEILYRHFRLQGRLTSLVGDVDQNLLLVSSGEKFVVKISAELKQSHLLQQAILDHIRRVDPSLSVPELILDLNEKPAVSISQCGKHYCLRLYRYIPGKPLRYWRKSPELLQQSANYLGRISNAMQGFGHQDAYSPGRLWNLDHPETAFAWVETIPETSSRALVARAIANWRRLQPQLASLPAMITHHDANDDNLLIEKSKQKLSFALIDFGDAVFSRRINELAIFLAYGLMDVSCIVTSAMAIIRGYCRQMPLLESELRVLFTLVASRLAVSICISSNRLETRPTESDLQVSRQQAIDLLEKISTIKRELASAIALESGGFSPLPHTAKLINWIKQQPQPVSPLPFDLHSSAHYTVDLSEGSDEETAFDTTSASQRVRELMQAHAAKYCIGLYGEARNIYRGAEFTSRYCDQARTIHLGIDLFVSAETPIHAVLAGKIHSMADNSAPYDYGPTIILEHCCGDGMKFWTLYGHLSRKSLQIHRIGDLIAAGQVIGSIGDETVNGGWPPHLHLQIITDLLGESGSFPGVCEAILWPVWSLLSPDPNLLLRLPAEAFKPSHRTTLRERRERLLAPSLSLSYEDPIEIVRGKGCWLYDQNGRGYLDCVNNIAHVGHCHPKVVDAIHAQAAILNTNTRYLHSAILDYADALLSRFPDCLDTCYFVCSGSEANELALRIATHYSQRKTKLILDWAYHGNTSTLLSISPYKFKQAGGMGLGSGVYVADLPDLYRGRHRGNNRDTALAYAQSIAECIRRCEVETGAGPGVFIHESIASCGGQVFYPDGYLTQAYAYVRQGGGLCIADEVQTGFGRVGEYWAFTDQGVIPDIVTLGKPMGNGHPIAAVVTRRELAESFANGIEYFNSFAGNPVSAAAGLAVIQVLEEEELIRHATSCGEYLLDGLRKLAVTYPVIGDVRGKGLFIGVEMIEDYKSRKPAPLLANTLINQLRAEGVLLSCDGPERNVLKIKPPMVFSENNADFLLHKLADALDNMHSIPA